MLLLAMLIVFAGAVVVTSGLVHEARAWRYAMGFSATCAVILTLLAADVLQRVARAAAGTMSPALAFGLAALPFAIVLLRLWHRRIHTPHRTPGPDDDPVLRRYLEEKLRRLRRRRQQEDLMENSDDAGESPTRNHR